MPLPLPSEYPTLLIRRAAFERAQLTRTAFEERFALTQDDFRVEGDLIAIGPLVGDDTLTGIVAELEALGLVYFDDFVEMSGNWPAWLTVFAATNR
ncbi:MAG: hypothetical protein ACHQTF_03685 [Gemmatimonadales bacterium]